MTSTIGRRNNCGFTLFELILVMLIVSVLAALAAPTLRGFIAGRKCANAAAQIVALGQYARTQAVGTGTVYRLNFDPSNGTYWLSSQSGAEFSTLRNEFGRPFQLPDGTSANWQTTAVAQPCFQFYPDGRVEAATLELHGAVGEVVAIGCRSETEPLTILKESQ